MSDRAAFWIHLTLTVLAIGCSIAALILEAKGL